MLAIQLAAGVSYATAFFGLAGSLIGGFIAGAVTLLVARQTREAAEGAWIRDNRRGIYDRFLTFGQKLLIACEERWDHGDARPLSGVTGEMPEWSVESADIDFFEVYGVVQTVAGAALVAAARDYGYRLLELEAIMRNKGTLGSQDFRRVAELVREARHHTIDAMRAELGLAETSWPSSRYNPFHGTDLEEKYAKRARVRQRRGETAGLTGLAPPLPRSPSQRKEAAADEAPRHVQ